MTRRTWTDADSAYLRKHWHTDMAVKDIAAHLGRSITATRKRADELKVCRPSLKTPQSFLDDVMAEYLTSSAKEIAARRGVKYETVRKWIAMARHG